MGLKQFSCVLSVYLFLTVHTSHESCSATFLSCRCYFGLNTVICLVSEPKPPVKMVRKLSSMAPDIFLDHSVLLMPVLEL